LESGDDCWVWGHDPSYYANLGCAPLGQEATVARRGHCSGMDPADPAPLNGRVALTFDDGPHPTVTPQILAILREHGVPATFFVLGEEVDAYPDVVEEIADDPLFAVGNHSWNHKDLALFSEGVLREQVEWTESALTGLG